MAVIASPGWNLKCVPAEGDVRLNRYAASILSCLVLVSVLLIISLFVAHHSANARPSSESSRASRRRGSDAIANRRRQAAQNASAPARGAGFSMPVSFEPNVGQAKPGTEFVGRGGGATVLLTRDGMEFAGGGVAQLGKAGNVTLRFMSAAKERSAANSRVAWEGGDRLAGETNYFLGNDPTRWRTHVPHFGDAIARNVIRGVDVVAYGSAERLEYDMRVAPGTNPAELRLAISGAENVRVDSFGDLVMMSGGRELRMRKPLMYEEISARFPQSGDGNSKRNLETAAGSTADVSKKIVDGGYAIEADGTVGFRVGAHDPASTLVIDPSLSVGYATFLGGAGDDRAASVALDSIGKVYIGGTTTSVSTFAETSGVKQGNGGGGSDFFIAKIDPTNTGVSSLVYLTFIGGSGNEAGGAIAVDASGNVALAGTSTSIDYPVTDGSVLTAGVGGVAVNDAAITEIGPAGATLVYSTLFGGNGNEATQSAGGIALDSSGNIFVAMDTQSTNLTVAPTTGTGPFQPVYGGGVSDGFLAIFHPVVTGSAAHLEYCTYLGISAQATVTGVAVDTVGNAYLAGYTNDPLGTLATTNGFQTTYGGGTDTAFVMKILPSGMGSADLSYGTFLGGSVVDQALAIAVSKQLPGTVYVTGTTQSPDFPVNGTVAPLQTNLNGTANAFVSVIAQLSNDASVLTYSSYLGGSQSDAGRGIFFGAANQIYVTGSAKSWDFPWQFNFQPFSGDEDVFVAEIDPTSAGSASLLYATPLGGSAAAGMTALAQGNGIAVSAAGIFFVAGATSANDFPRAGGTNGVQLNCASCQENPPLNDAFLVEGIPSAVAKPSVSFDVAKLNFGAQPVGSTTVPPQAVGVINTGDAPLNITQVGITGANAGDFSLMGPGACTAAGPIAPGQKCSFAVGFVGSVVGPEGAFLSFTDDGPASPQALAMVGVGGGPFAVISPGTVDCGDQLVNTTSSTCQLITVTNSGNQPLVFSGVQISGSGAAEFAPASPLANRCVAGPSTVAAGQGCIFGFSFKPTATGVVNAEVDFFDNSGGVAGTEQIVPISGTGVASGFPILTVAPTSLGFGTQQVGVATGAQILTLTNSGSADLNYSFSLTGAGAASFADAGMGSSLCSTPTGRITARSNCTLGVSFDPLTAGAANAALSISDNASGSPQSVPLSGTGGTTGISVAPASVNFSTQTVGSASTVVNVTVKNTGSSPTALTITMGGMDPGDFRETDGCTGSPLGAGATCKVSAAFAPTQAGSLSAMIQVSNNVPQNQQTIVVSGTAVVAEALITPATGIIFKPRLAGTASDPVNVKVKNSGMTPAMLDVSRVMQTDATDFTLKNGCGAAIAANASCTMAVAFRPAVAPATVPCGSTAGTKSSTLTIVDNAPTSAQNPATLAFSGVSMDYCLVAAAANSSTVTAGGSGAFQIEAESFESFTDTIALTCTATVTQGVCTVQPASLNLAANATTPFQVNITTTAATTSASGGFGKGVARIFVFLPVSGFIWTLVVSAFGLKRRCANALRLAQACVVLVALSVGFAACGGGGSQSAAVAAGTPAGSYPITITGTTSTGATRTVGLMLTVQ